MEPPSRNVSGQGASGHRGASAVANCADGGTFSYIVARCQRAGVLPAVDTVNLTGLIYAALHGAIDLDIGGRAADAKGLGSIDATAGLLFELLKGHRKPRRS